MNVFLEEMGKLYAGDKVILVMDGAGWHKSKNLQVPDNIEIITLPPYSPKLNPVERFWKNIKQNTIKNQIYTGIKELKNSLQQFLNSITKETVMSLNVQQSISVKLFYGNCIKTAVTLLIYKKIALSVFI